MTTAADLFELVYAALLPQPTYSPTSAEGRIDRNGVLPTQPDDYSRIKLRLISENKQSMGRSSLSFLTTPTIRIIGEVAAPVSAVDARASGIENELWALKAQIERAIINSNPLFQRVQQLVSVQTQLAYEAQATMLAGIQSDYTFEIYETADDFAPPEVDDLTAIVVSDPLHHGVRWGADNLRGQP